jgi:uncharacterized protein (TIGR00661 family)
VLINFQHKKVLVAPLDWGLGHATRCIPIIQQLLQNKNDVWIAADGNIENLLKSEFPTVQFVKLFNYNIQYANNGSLLWLKMLQQSNHILRCIDIENKWLNNFIQSEKIDVVISDNRYGLYHADVHSVFITHQLQLAMPKPFGHFEWISKLFFQKYIKQYNECWIPDYADEKNNLSGKLSHSKTDLKNIKFINPLSRFNESVSAEKIESDILILISGPEPQRTLFEELVISQLNKISIQQKKIIVVGGNFENRNANFSLPEGVIYHASISPNEIKKYLVGAKKIICRSGYSTIMDLEALKLNAVFVPTPGQTEQEYLARWLQINSASTFVKQHQFDLKKYI